VGSLPLPIECEMIMGLGLTVGSQSCSVVSTK